MVYRKIGQAYYFLIVRLVSTLTDVTQTNFVGIFILLSNLKTLTLEQMMDMLSGGIEQTHILLLITKWRHRKDRNASRLCGSVVVDSPQRLQTMSLNLTSENKNEKEQDKNLYG